MVNFVIIKIKGEVKTHLLYSFYFSVPELSSSKYSNAKNFFYTKALGQNKGYLSLEDSESLSF